ncbi:MAG: 3-deoxy-8-phosphooctulonate synthase [Elusimicrobia bacterium HGW-Elusimicrobia-1]|jgi:2-dehydro-3-deoxyphosphooctonate aldolase (KDO 8-P synthase)|nr:MAG: 3-deoxy-8-phosphooctulonate synthase [Elusimicrobia bacterium HGW-Elusimicrobia-1]
MKTVNVGKIKIGGENPLVLFAGPCVLEKESEALAIAERLVDITSRLQIPFVFKASYDKGNRSNVDYYRGPGIEKGLRMLDNIRKATGAPVISDIHCRAEIPAAAEVLDIIQIPAYLCQQTDLVVAAAKALKPLNIKKGQFLAPWDMGKVAAKAASAGNENIMLTERGNFFGYNNLVCDMRSIPIMRETGHPVLADITHMVRLPGPPSKDASGGQPQFIAPLSYAAVAAGADGLFLEVHPEPKNALCDAASMLRLDLLEKVLETAKKISEAVRAKGK